MIFFMKHLMKPIFIRSLIKYYYIIWHLGKLRCTDAQSCSRFPVSQKKRGSPMSPCSVRVVLKLEGHQPSLEVTQRFLGPTPWVFDSVGLGRIHTQELAFLVSSQVMPMLLQWGSHVENRCPISPDSPLRCNVTGFWSKTRCDFLHAGAALAVVSMNSCPHDVT